MRRRPQCGPDGQVCGPPGTRRRGETLERAIFDAVLAELDAVGYDAMTMEGVAARAQTGKAALYRRWPSKQELVLDTMQCQLPPCGDLPETGTVRGDLLVLLGGMAAMFGSPTGAATQSVMGSLKRNPDIAEAVHERVIAPRQRLMMNVLRRGAERGEVRRDAVSTLVAAVGPSMIIHKFMTEGPPITEKTVEAIIDEVVLPMLRP